MLLYQLVEADKIRPDLQFFDRIVEGLDGLCRISHHDGTLLGPVVRIFGCIVLAQN